MSNSLVTLTYENLKSLRWPFELPPGTLINTGTSADSLNGEPIKSTLYICSPPDNVKYSVFVSVVTTHRNNRLMTDMPLSLNGGASDAVSPATLMTLPGGETIDLEEPVRKQIESLKDLPAYDSVSMQGEVLCCNSEFLSMIADFPQTEFMINCTDTGKYYVHEARKGFVEVIGGKTNADREDNFIKELQALEDKHKMGIGSDFTVSYVGNGGGIINTRFNGRKSRIPNKQ